MPKIDSPARAIARNVLVVVGVLLVLYVIYLLRKPISWLIIAAFLAIALAGPVNFFQRYMKRGLAIALVYFGLLLIPIGLGAVLIPPIVNQVRDVATNAPQLRARRRGLRPQEQDPQRPQQQVRHHPEALRRGEQAAQQGRRRRRSPARHRLRAGQLDLRRRHDPGPEHLHGRRRAEMDRELHTNAETRARRADRANPAANRQRRRQLRRRSAAAGDDRGPLGVHHADHPRGAVCGPARGGHLRLRPDPGDRRHDRRGPGRDRHRLRQLPDRPDHLDRLRGRLPAGRELPDPAADPEAGDEDRGFHRPGRRALRQHPVRHPRRASSPSRWRPRSRSACTSTASTAAR